MIIPVAFVQEGKNVKVSNILMNEIMGKKLREMGLSNGSNIEVIKNDGASIILNVSGSRLAVGMGMAQKIMVEEN